MVSTIEQRQQKYKTIIENFTLFHNKFMTKVLVEKECCEFVLRIILKNPNLHIVDVKTEYPLTNLHGRSLRLDIFAIDDLGRTINLEIQRDMDKAPPQRGRLHLGLMDANTTDPGSDFQDLPVSYVIFIMQNDEYKQGKDIYHVEKMMKETGEVYDDSAYLMYVNGEYCEDDSLGRLMHDFGCRDPEDMYYEVLAKQVGYLKHSKEGHKQMDDILEELYNEGKSEGKEEGLMETLVKQLTRKFKVLSERLIKAIHESSLEMLERLLEAIFDVNCEEDVFMILNQ